MIALQIEGQTLELPETVAVNDDCLRRAIAPLFPQAANARFERVTDAEGRTVIKMTKEAGTKGLTAEALAKVLKGCPRHVNPAVVLHQRLQSMSDHFPYEDVLRLEAQIERAVKAGERELKVTHAILSRLLHAPGVPAQTPPVGF
jgi:hypothetical protein